MVFSHPDDETTIGPLLVKYARQGHDVRLISITSGQQGIRPHAGIPAGAALGDIRAEELRCSARALGIAEPYLLGYEDQGIAPLGAFWEITERVREIVNRVRPDVMLSWGPDGITGHTDHRVAAEIATVVFQERRLLTCNPRKLYFCALPESVFAANPNPLNRKRPFLLVDDRFITTEIDCTETLEAGLRAIHCHRTQWRPERMEQLKAFYGGLLGGKTYLRLALTTAGWPRERERCLFEGLD